jgi:hypothetical protein
MKTCPFVVLLALMGATGFAHAGEAAIALSVAVPVLAPGKERAIVAFDRGSFFHVILASTSDKPQRILAERDSWGEEAALSFEITDAAGEKSVARGLRHLYKKGMENWCILQPHESMVMDIYFADSRRWMGFPHPAGYGRSQTVTMRAVFEVKPSKGRTDPFWTGRVVSEPVKCVFYNRMPENKAAPIAQPEAPSNASAQPPDLPPSHDIHVKCTPAYYAQYIEGRLVSAEDASRGENFLGCGVVLRIVEPGSLEGKIMALGWDGPLKWNSWYKPGVIYEGMVDQRIIGRLAFMDDPGLHPVSGPWVTEKPNQTNPAPATAREPDGLALRIHVPSTEVKPDGTVPAFLVLSNGGPRSIRFSMLGSPWRSVYPGGFDVTWAPGQVKSDPWTTEQFVQSVQALQPGQTVKWPFTMIVGTNTTLRVTAHYHASGAFYQEANLWHGHVDAQPLTIRFSR